MESTPYAGIRAYQRICEIRHGQTRGLQRTCNLPRKDTSSCTSACHVVEIAQPRRRLLLRARVEGPAVIRELLDSLSICWQMTAQHEFQAYANNTSLLYIIHYRNEHRYAHCNTPHIYIVYTYIYIMHTSMCVCNYTYDTHLRLYHVFDCVRNM